MDRNFDASVMAFDDLLTFFKDIHDCTGCDPRDQALCSYDIASAIKIYLEQLISPHVWPTIPESHKQNILRIHELMTEFPEDMHQCIGCPCIEFDYPNCSSCPFLHDCLSGQPPYPKSCKEEYCFRTMHALTEHSLSLHEASDLTKTDHTQPEDHHEKML